MKNKGVAILLALFLGGLGAHHFYLGNNTKGVLYLLFCWTFIPGILALIDTIIFLTIPETEWNRRFNSQFMPNGQQQNQYGQYQNHDR